MESTYFDWLPDELLYVICTFLGPDYNSLYKYKYYIGSDNTYYKKLDKAYKNFIDDVTSGITFAFKLFHQRDLRFYRSVGSYNLRDYIELSMKKNNNILTGEIIEYYDRLFSEQMDDIPLEIIKEIKDLKFVIYADYTYYYIPGVNAEQMIVVYINTRDEYVLWEHDGESSEKEIYTNINWKMIWTRLVKRHQDNILEINGYKV